MNSFEMKYDDCGFCETIDVVSKFSEVLKSFGIKVTREESRREDGSLSSVKITLDEIIEENKKLS